MDVILSYIHHTRLGNHNMIGMPAPGPQSLASKETFKFKYTQKGEDFRAVCNRVSACLADSDYHFREFRDVMLDGRFTPAGRILSSLGTTKAVTPYNCFVSGTIGDSLRGPGSILCRFEEAAETMRRGGGIGYDFSTIRPRNAIIRSLDSHAAGPVGFLEMFNTLGSMIASTGERRGAQMGILRVDHPDIEEFIHAKQNDNKLSRFNLSIAVTDEFMGAVDGGSLFPLRFEGEVYRLVNARALWETIMRSTWDWAEPGVVFIDTINKENNLQYCETIAATNPCSEQPLPPFGACLLGSFNLVRYLRHRKGKPDIDVQSLRDDVKHVVRAMDNVVDTAIYPLPEQKEQAEANRRMGLGFMGMANAIEAIGYEYGTEDYIDVQSAIMDTLMDAAYYESAMLAKEKGAFPAYTSKYLEQPFVRRLDPATFQVVRDHGIRNSHLVSMAPTGTISFCMGHVSSGIEPVFAVQQERIVQMPGGPVNYEVEDYSYKYLGVKPRTADEVTPEEHIAVLAAAQKYTDSAVSKTCNVPADTSWLDFKGIYKKAWAEGAKGCATFTTGGKRGALLQAKPVADCEGAACAIAS